MDFLASNYTAVALDVYTRDTTLPGKEGPVAFKEVVTLGRYTQPTEDQVLAHLQEKARSLGVIKKLAVSGTAIRVESALEAALLQLPQRVLDDLQAGSLDCVRFVRNNIPVSNLRENEEARRYAQICFGYMPPELASKLESGEMAGDLPMFVRFQRGLVELASQSTLGLRGKVDYLLNPSNGDVRKVSCSFGSVPYDVVVGLFNALNGLSVDGISQYHDLSPEKVEEFGIPAVAALQQNVLEAVVRQRQAGQAGRLPGLVPSIGGSLDLRDPKKRQ